MPTWVSTAIDWMVGEGRAVMAAPITFLVGFVAIAWGCWKLSGWYYARDIRGRDAALQLGQKHLEIVKDENAALLREMERSKSLAVPVSAAPVSYGNSVIQTVVAEIKQGSVIFYGNPEQWSPQQISKFAAYSHLRDAGLVNIAKGTDPTSATVTGTASLASVREWIGPKGGGQRDGSKD